MSDLLLDPGVHELGYFRAAPGQWIRATGPGVTIIGAYESYPAGLGCGIEGYGDDGRIRFVFKNDLTDGRTRPGLLQLSGVDTSMRYVDFDCQYAKDVQGCSLLNGWKGTIEFCSFGNIGVSSSSLASDRGKVHAIYARSCVPGATIRDVVTHHVTDGYGLHAYSGTDPTAVKGLIAERIHIDQCLHGLAVWQYEPGDVSQNRILKVLITNIAQRTLINNMGLTGPGTDQQGNVIDYVTTPTPGYGAGAGEIRPPDVVPAPVVHPRFEPFCEHMGASSMYRDWKRKNPKEAAKWETYSAAILAGETPPSELQLATLFGQGLVDGAAMATL